MKKCLLVLLLGYITGITAQDSIKRIDLKYLEDQFYTGITYNFILNKPSDVTQRNFSYGLMGGFIKDIPLNADRNVGFGLGLGYALNTYYTNLLATETQDGIVYSIIDADISYRRNKLEIHLIEMPIEFRWRSSSPSDHKFWRIYTGIKLAYAVGSRSKFVSDMEKISFRNPDIEKFQYGIILNFGYNTFNFHAYYGLNNLFKDGIVTDTGESIKFKPLRIGISFYIL
jgi:hypothetical protein